MPTGLSSNRVVSPHHLESASIWADDLQKVVARLIDLSQAPIIKDSFRSVNGMAVNSTPSVAIKTDPAPIPAKFSPRLSGRNANTVVAPLSYTRTAPSLSSFTRTLRFGNLSLTLLSHATRSGCRTTRFPTTRIKV